MLNSKCNQPSSYMDVDDAVIARASDLTGVPDSSDRSLEAGPVGAGFADVSRHSFDRPGEDVQLARPRLGILALHPIQYHAPLYQRLASRGRVRLDVLHLHATGSRLGVDPGFGVPVAWDIDLLSGYEHSFLDGSRRWWPGRLGAMGQLVRWLRSHEVVVINGYSDPWMLFAAAACRTMGVPFLLRGMSAPEGAATGIRRRVRDGIARAVVSSSVGGLALGKPNRAFYVKYGAPRIFFTPNSVDNDRFARVPDVGRSELLARWGLDDTAPVIMFCGKLYPRKRPLDLVAAVGSLEQEVTTIFVGDGVLADQVRALLRPGRGVVTGFVNQADLPAYYHAADILVLPSDHEPWGLVVNEAMVTGTLPVVSDRVGAASDLVEGIGEVFPCGDVTALAEALRRALGRLGDPEVSDRVRRRVARYSIDIAAAGFEEAALAAPARPPRRGYRASGSGPLPGRGHESFSKMAATRRS
jgi:glycosyltransferase involved in cell wall biosynthesis